MTTNSTKAAAAFTPMRQTGVINLTRVLRDGAFRFAFGYAASLIVEIDRLATMAAIEGEAAWHGDATTASILQLTLT